ncbi:MAG TPA: stalk domain-containing protein [Candidatus Tyrphobacter sp.]
MRKLFALSASVVVFAALISVPMIAGAQPTAPATPDFGSPPSGAIPILYNDTHVYAKPDILRQDRVLAALVRHGSLLIPLRSMFEQMGATVSYDPSTQTVTVSKSGASVQVTVGKPDVVVNGETRPLDVPPIMWQGQVLVPVRVLSEGMGAYVLWVPDRHLVVVRYIPPTPPPPPPTVAPAPPPPPPTPMPRPARWNGAYIGLNAGWGHNLDTGTNQCVNPAGMLNGTGCPIPEFGNISAPGYFGGVQLGINWEANPIVFGLEGDYQVSNLHGSWNLHSSLPLVGGGFSGPITYTADERIAWFTTARARLGVLLSPSALLYATGGWEEARADLNSDLDPVVISYPGSADVTRSGFVYGGGIEVASSPTVSWKLEALDANLGSYTILAPPVPAIIVTKVRVGKTFEFRGPDIRLGVNFKL